MKILITNDDGIFASGLVRLVRAALFLGDVTVIAPDREHSAQARRITVDRPIDLVPYDFPVPGVTAWSCSGSPVDCVRVGLFCLLPEKPDLVLSGLNYGNNVASDIQYSATVGAALEAAHHSVPAIAFSEAFKGDPDLADRYLPSLLADLAVVRPGQDVILNVNFPEGDCRGILTDRTVSSGSLHSADFRLIERLPGGGLRLDPGSVRGDLYEEGSDLRAVLDGYVSIGTVKNLG